jgi:tripartite-type tricarboxylate transporter receptor subunit TctC
VDLAIRIVAAVLSERLCQQFIVDNRTGAGGTVGTEAAAQSAPDGATFLVGSPGNMAINPAVTRGLRYDAVRDFIAVNHVVSFPQVLVVSPTLPVRTLPELVAYSRERPGQLNYASSGFGSTNHLAMEMIRAATGLDAVHVPYRGGLQTVQAILTNDVHMCIEGIFTLPPFLADGKVRAIAVTTSTRSHVLPDVPAIAETVPDFDAGAWIILFAPAGTPTPIVERLSEEVNRSLARPAVRERLAERGATLVGTTPAAAAAFHRGEVEKFRRVAERAGISN